MKNKIIEINGKKYKRISVNETPLREQELDEGIIDDLLKKIVAKISSSDQKTVKQLSKKDPKFAKVYKQFMKARSDLESSLRANKGFYASI
jgi:TRAP-type mannitol/chloroaromatic compound transport system substrate-binding protein